MKRSSSPRPMERCHWTCCPANLRAMPRRSIATAGPFTSHPVALHVDCAGTVGSNQGTCKKTLGSGGEQAHIMSWVFGHPRGCHCGHGQGARNEDTRTRAEARTATGWETMYFADRSSKLVADAHKPPMRCVNYAQLLVSNRWPSRPHDGPRRPAMYCGTHGFVTPKQRKTSREDQSKGIRDGAALSCIGKAVWQLLRGTLWHTGAERSGRSKGVWETCLVNSQRIECREWSKTVQDLLLQVRRQLLGTCISTLQSTPFSCLAGAAPTCGKSEQASGHTGIFSHWTVCHVRRPTLLVVPTQLVSCRALLVTGNTRAHNRKAQAVGHGGRFLSFGKRRSSQQGA